MIDIQVPDKCCGCSACLQICPQKCITFIKDHEGFYYPQVNKDVCIDCGLCEKVCPELHQFEVNKTSKAYAVINRQDNVRLQSSSGGFFSALAQNFIDKGGYVFGARFDKSWNVIHSCTNNSEELQFFRGSKYVQSNMNNCYIRAKDLLKKGENVLFTGTPCQILALNNFLRKDYSNLITAEVVCHGVPSPLVWNKYLYSLKKKLIHDDSYQYTSINFRDKKLGWIKFSQSFVLESNTNREKIYYSETVSENLFMRGFLRHLYLRPSCHQCPAKGFVSRSDFTIADFWGYHSDNDYLNMKNGISLVFVNTPKAESLFDKLDITYEEHDIHGILKSNYALSHSFPPSRNRKKFFQYLNSSEVDLLELILNLSRPSRYERFKKFIKKIIYKFYGEKR